MKGEAMTKCADGVERDLFPVGTKVRHTTHTQLTGEVVAHEMTQPGVPSAAPYRVYWDTEEATRVLGWMWLYPAHESLERVAE